MIIKGGITYIRHLGIATKEKKNRKNKDQVYIPMSLQASIGQLIYTYMMKISDSTK